MVIYGGLRTGRPGPSCTLVCLWAMLGPTDHGSPTRCALRSASSFGPLGLSRSLGHCLSSWGAGTCFSGVLLPCDPSVLGHLHEMPGEVSVVFEESLGVLATRLQSSVLGLGDGGP